MPGKRVNIIYWDLPLEGRPSRLRERVDRCYLELVKGFPGPLRTRALQRSTYLGQADPSSFPGVSAVNPIIAGAPWLFWELGQALPDEEFLPIAVSGACLALAYLLQDHLVDGQFDDPGLVILLANGLFERGLRKLQAHFLPEAPFWDEFDRLMSEQRASLALELESRRNPGILDYGTFRLTAQGKVAPAAITVAALTHKTGQEELFHPAERSLKEAIIAGQMGHDVSDWRKDLRAGHLTYFLRSSIPNADWRVDRWPGLAEVESRINAQWLEADGFGRAKGLFEKARSIASGLNCLAWESFLGEYVETAARSETMAGARHLLSKLS